jgi:hypothetical protein
MPAHVACCDSVLLMEQVEAVHSLDSPAACQVLLAAPGARLVQGSAAAGRHQY